MKREIKAPVVIEDGLKKGVIIAVEERTDPFKYIDVTVEFKEDKDRMMKLTVGYPDFMSTTSKLGCLMARFKVDMSTPGTFVDTDVLVGQKCQFIVNNAPSKKDAAKTYANIVPESLKPGK